MTVRAKFKVASITRMPGWNGHAEVQTIKLQAVTSGSEENAKFFAATPGGNVEISCVVPAVAAQFDIGKEFYVDFTPA